MSDAELLEFILAHSGADENTADLLLSKLHSIKAATDADHGILTAQYGVSMNTAVLLKLIPAVCHEKSTNRKSGNRIGSTENAGKYFSNLFTGYSEEYFAAAAIKDSMWISGSPFIRSSGSFSNVSVKCRDIVRYAVSGGRNKLILAHNHPNGVPNPSENDIIATKKIIASLKPLEIKVLDHIIVGKDSYVSLREIPGLISFESAPEYKCSCL